MALLYKRDFHSFSTIQEHTPQGWDWCMSKAYCKWPVIIAIIIAIVIAVFTLYCCLRCCGCCNFGRRGGRRRANTQQPFAGFNPLAYQGYAPAGAPAPGYGPPEPPRYAQFDNTHRKMGSDSLPAMPTWNQGQDRKVLMEEEDIAAAGSGPDMEMSHIDRQQKTGLMHNASTVDLAPPAAKKHTDGPYTGPDFDAVDTSYGGAGAAAAATHPDPSYTGPDFGHGAGHPANPPYKPYQAFASQHNRTPTHDMGTTYGNTRPPASPTEGGFSHAPPPPSVLQPGHRPEGGFRDV